MIKDFSTALRQDREKNIALSRLKKEFAVQRCVDVHQLDGASEPFMAFPHALDLNEPCMVFCLDHLAGKHILGAVETSFGRDGIASTCVCSASAHTQQIAKTRSLSSFFILPPPIRVRPNGDDSPTTARAYLITDARHLGRTVVSGGTAALGSIFVDAEPQVIGRKAVSHHPALSSPRP